MINNIKNILKNKHNLAIVITIAIAVLLGLLSPIWIVFEVLFILSTAVMCFLAAAKFFVISKHAKQQEKANKKTLTNKILNQNPAHDIKQKKQAKSEHRDRLLLMLMFLFIGVSLILALFGKYL